MSIFIYKSTHIVILIPCSHSSTFTFLVLQSPGELRCAALILSYKHLSYKRDLPENFFRKIVRQHHMIPKSNFTFTKSVRQISGDHRRAAAILSDKACPTKVTLQSQTCSNFVRQNLSDKSPTAASTFSNFVRQHQKRAGSFSSSPFPVDHYSVFTHCAEISAI